MDSSSSITDNPAARLSNLKECLQQLNVFGTQTVDCVLPFTGISLSHDSKLYLQKNNRLVFSVRKNYANVSYSSYGTHVSQAVNAQSSLASSISVTDGMFILSDNYASQTFPYMISPSWRGLGCFPETVTLLSSQSDIFKRTLSVFQVPLDASLWYYSGELDTSWQGDYSIRDKQGAGGFFQGRLITAIEGGKFCSTIWSAANQKIIQQCLCSQRVSPTYMQAYQNHQHFQLTGYTPIQVLGVLAGGVSTKPQHIRTGYGEQEQTVQFERLCYAQEQNVNSGLFRFQQFTAPAVHGKNVLVTVPAKDSKTVQSSKDINVLYHQQLRPDGSFTQKSTSTIASIKSPYIAAFSYFQQPVNLTDQKLAKEVPLADKIKQLSNDQAIQLDVPVLQAQLRAAPQYSEQYKASQRLTKTAPVTAPEVIPYAQQRKLDCNGTAFVPDKATSVPINQQESAQVHPSTSIIHQLPDGSIIIKDGYGSEIRMVRGNIIISSALDIVLRPGRHIRGTVPGDMSMAAQNIDIVGRKTIDMISKNDIKLDSDAVGITGKQATFMHSKEMRVVSDKILIDHSKDSSGVSLCINGQDADIGISAKNFDVRTTGSFSCLTEKHNTMYGVCCSQKLQVAAKTINVSCDRIYGQPSQTQVAYKGHVWSLWDPDKISHVSVQAAPTRQMPLYSAKQCYAIFPFILCKTVTSFENIWCNGGVYSTSMAACSSVGVLRQPPMKDKSFNEYKTNSFGVLTISTDAPDIQTWQQNTSAWRVRLPQSAQYGVTKADTYFLTQISWQASVSNPLHVFNYQLDGCSYYQFPGKECWENGQLLCLSVPAANATQYSINKNKKLRTSYTTNFNTKQEGR